MEETKHVEDNLPEGNPESAPNDTLTSDRKDAEDFFASLDRDVNSLTYDDNMSKSEESTSQQTTVQEEHPVANGEIEQDSNLDKRYADSSREAKRLNTRLKELEPFVPLLDAFRGDPKLIQHTRDYFEGGGQPPKSLKEKLGLDEDFVFDGDEAMNNPSSDSARVFGAAIDGVVNRKLNQYQEEASLQQRRQADNTQFRQTHNMTDEEYEQLVNFAQSRPLTLDDIYYLKNREERDKNVANSTRQEMRSQMKNVRQKPASLASAGSQQGTEKSGDDSLFDNILGMDRDLESAFN
tara:strand:- start:361 stop:1242 length:882 start_codon:yes stop_codon:yes gene_type:complete